MKRAWRGESGIEIWSSLLAEIWVMVSLPSSRLVVVGGKQKCPRIMIADSPPLPFPLDLGATTFPGLTESLALDQDDIRAAFEAKRLVAVLEAAERGLRLH